MQMRWIRWAGLGVLVMAVAIGLLAWRYRAPVRVTFDSQVTGAALDVEPLPAEVDAPPGKMQRVVFRVHNPGSDVRRLKGSVTMSPAVAEEQVEIFAMQCGDSSTVQPGETREFAVVFRVAAAGLRGAREVALLHHFEPAAARP